MAAFERCRKPFGPKTVTLVVLLALASVLNTSSGFTLFPSPSYISHNSHLSVITEREAEYNSRCSSAEDTSDHDESSFFIRHCLRAEIGQASDILTDAFFKDNTNFITYQWERLSTYLSLEGFYPRPGDRHALFVACESKTGKVLGLAEIDDMPTKDRNATPRPYMFNVAVTPKWRRQGIARALVLACEEVARTWNKPVVYLKVRDTSEAAIAMYDSLGYQQRSAKIEKLNNKYQNLIVMSKYVMEGCENTRSKDATDDNSC